MYFCFIGYRLNKLLTSSGQTVSFPLLLTKIRKKQGKEQGKTMEATAPLQFILILKKLNAFTRFPRNHRAGNDSSGSGFEILPLRLFSFPGNDRDGCCKKKGGIIFNDNKMVARAFDLL